MMIAPKQKAPKNEYSESQTAAILGISIEQLRTLIRQQVGPDEDLSGLAMATYSSSDLVLLRMLATHVQSRQA